MKENKIDCKTQKKTEVNGRPTKQRYRTVMDFPTGLRRVIKQRKFNGNFLCQNDRKRCYRIKANGNQ